MNLPRNLIEVTFEDTETKTVVTRTCHGGVFDEFDIDSFETHHCNKWIRILKYKYISITSDGYKIIQKEKGEDK